MEARIRKDALTAFKEQAAFIKPISDRPILEYLKVEIEGDFATLTKSNDKNFIQKTIGNDSDDCVFLVNEKILYDFMNYSDAEFINFSIEGIRCTISDPKNHIISQTESPKMFPFVDTAAASEGVVLPKLVLVAAGIGAQIIFDGEISGPKSNVFIGAHAVCGTDANIGYYQPIAEDVPELVLRKEVADCISKMNSCTYSTGANYDLFSDEETLYGFIKTEYKFTDMGRVFQMPDAENANFSCNKNGLMKFSSWTSASIKDNLLAATFTAKDNNLHLEMLDSKMNIEASGNIAIRGGEGNFKFNPIMMGKLLKLAPVEECFFYQLRDRYVITDMDKSFIAAIMLII